MAERLIDELIAIVGDFNDTPDSDPLAPLLKQTDLKDVFEHPDFDDGARQVGQLRLAHHRRGQHVTARQPALEGRSHSQAADARVTIADQARSQKLVRSPRADDVLRELIGTADSPRAILFAMLLENVANEPEEVLRHGLVADALRAGYFTSPTFDTAALDVLIAQMVLEPRRCGYAEQLRPGRVGEEAHVVQAYPTPGARRHFPTTTRASPGGSGARRPRARPCGAPWRCGGRRGRRTTRRWGRRRPPARRGARSGRPPTRTTPSRRR